LFAAWARGWLGIRRRATAYAQRIKSSPICHQRLAAAGQAVHGSVLVIGGQAIAAEGRSFVSELVDGPLKRGHSRLTFDQAARHG
jgi:hypothetical protein